MSQDQLFPNSYAWRIISLNEAELVVKRELTDQEKDYRDVMNLFDELYELKANISCNNASDWAYTPYGSNACGGPQSYIPYPKEIKESFLLKVASYSKAEHDYNEKWGISSTCIVPNQPKGIECQNGEAVLKY